MSSESLQSRVTTADKAGIIGIYIELPEVQMALEVIKAAKTLAILETTTAADLTRYEAAIALTMVLGAFEAAP